MVFDYLNSVASFCFWFLLLIDFANLGGCCVVLDLLVAFAELSRVGLLFVIYCLLCLF